MRRGLSQVYYHAMYYASWLAFGLVGLLLNLGCVPFLLLPRTPALCSRTRRVIRILFDLWARWFHATGVLHTRWIGFEHPLPAGAVYVANHPTLIDATLLLARLPEAFCIFKPALMRNPAIAPAALLAGYEESAGGIDTLRDTAAKVARGETLLVFPEGTRTGIGERLGAFRPGFALIATRGRVPVQSVVIRSSSGLVRRGRAWWRPPTQLPAWMEIEISTRWEYEPARTAVQLATAIEQRMREQISEPVR